ncbi:peptidase [Sphingomonas sp. Leaf412]|uniref:zinc-dependent metalloprotease n=1 Tax=Sphingomonas sp. Leaf412 TaxID=1736370 RepID=UPI0006F7B853|nr:zinc-dependent metalloprotease [Sphingomonas sp. Leaf412]KQT31692.1 peptidase [Sphingomonas sp. Leaf412]
MILRALALLLATAAPVSAQVSAPTLLPVEVDREAGRVLVTLPPPGADGVSARFLYTASLRTGLGTPETGLDHAQQGDTYVLAFRRMGKKVVAEYENPRFRATNGSPAEQRAARESLAASTAWVGDVAKTLPGGAVQVDLAGFLTRDVLGIAGALRQGGAGEYRLDTGASVVDAAATRVFPDNIELEARQTYVGDKPARFLTDVAPDARSLALTVHHSLIRLPAPGYTPIRFDPRWGGIFGAPVVDYAAPLGQDVVYTLAARFRLEKVDPAAARSAVKKPVTFHIDAAAPEPIRTALAEGVGWWRQAFEKAGYVDAFRVAILPADADPLDARYNVVNWVNRATRGWSYGQTVIDPRTGEIVRGSVLLGSLRVRQDMLIFEGLVGADKVGTGGPNDPVQAALARIRQLGAHEVGHAIGLEHNFAASTQDRASVMDYPAPRIVLKDGVPDLSDAYGVGVGAWDVAAIDRLYGQPAPGTTQAQADAAKAAALAASGLRFVADGDARPPSSGQPWASLWDDGADPVAELSRMMAVRRAAIDRFGPAALRPGEAVENLRRKFVPIWLLHRYQVEAAAKPIGGRGFVYPVAGGGQEAAATPVPADAQRAAIDALLATLTPAALTVPARLVPLLSAGRSGGNDRQFDIEVMQTAGGPVFDPLVAADVAATVTLSALLDPDRLQRLALQQAADPAMPGAQDVIARLAAATVDRASDPLTQRIATRTLLMLAQLSRDPQVASGVAAVADEAVVAAAARLAKGRDPWARSTARLLGDDDRLTATLAELPKRTPRVPPGMPIGGAESDWMAGL